VKAPRTVAAATNDGKSPTIPHEAAVGVSRPRRDGNKLARWLKSFGPGLITGAADDDPSGIGTYSVAGAAFGFATLWTALVTETVAATFARELGGSGEPRSGPIGAVVAQVVHAGGSTIDI